MQSRKVDILQEIKFIDDFFKTAELKRNISISSTNAAQTPNSVLALNGCTQNTLSFQIFIHWIFSVIFLGKKAKLSKNQFLLINRLISSLKQSWSQGLIAITSLCSLGKQPQVGCMKTHQLQQVTGTLQSTWLCFPFREKETYVCPDIGLMSSMGLDTEVSKSMLCVFHTRKCCGKARRLHKLWGSQSLFPFL